MKIHFKTFGCKVNQCETNEMIHKILSAGLSLSDKPETADIIIINSCTVTSKADRKTNQYLRKCLQLNPTARIYVTGCCVDRIKSEQKPNKCSEMPETEQVFGNDRNRTNVRFFNNSEKQNICSILGISLPFTFYLLPSPFTNHTRAFVKIQDGCNGRCTYCIVPKVRPKLLSKNPEDIISEIKNYISAGHKEIVLCGIRLGKYRYEMDDRRWELTVLIKELEKIKWLYRIRLSSIELNDITNDLIEHMATSKKLCQHLHIPLQSGDNKILADMRRCYTAQEFFNKLQEIRKKVPDIGITTDVIIGYPLDTDETLENTYNFVKKCQFSRLHIFKYSKRPGTAASKIDKACLPVLIKKWAAKMKKLDLQLRHTFLKKFSGKKLQVLTETNGYGYTSNYIHLKLPKSIPSNELVYCAQ
ncbi:MAG: tRNA (N(6)-L-threonylcarbamoyladenosine(37)-C(2))-methylthiotransferase MtaB [Elusimicrobiota bacterium]